MSSAVQDKIEDMQTGSTNQVELPRKEILATSVPVPPLAEQRRIVEKIEELFSLIEAGEQALEQAKKLLERYRQSVLKAAVTGELTREWRARHKDEIEPGEVLLRRILQARREAWEKAELDKMAKRGLTPKDDRWKQKYKEPEPPDTTSLPELPEGWVWASLDQLVSGEPRSLQSGPFGSNLRHSEFTEHGILVIGIDNVRNGTFSMGRGNRISYRKFQELSKYSARARDLLVTVMASLGRTCVVPPDLEAAIITKHVYRVSMNLDCLEPEFFNLVLQSDTTSRARMLANAQGQTRPGLNGSILSELPMPLPSLREQQESIRLVDEMLSSIRPILNAVEVEIRRSAALRQAILTAAFKGRLVPQDPADEPASALLERLRAERTAAGKPKPSRRGRPAEVAAGADGAPELPLG